MGKLHSLLTKVAPDLFMNYLYDRNTPAMQSVHRATSDPLVPSQIHSYFCWLLRALLEWDQVCTRSMLILMQVFFGGAVSMAGELLAG